MSTMAIGAIGMAILFALLAIRIPVAFAMFAVGFGGIAILNGMPAAMSLLASETFTLASSAELIVVPLFILMGNVATATGMSRRLYDAAYAIIGSIRGGLASATIIGCGGFAALSGSYVASALTMGKVSLAEMKRFNYDPRLSTGAVAAGAPIEAVADQETVAVPEDMLGRGEHYVLRVRGDSMIDEQIRDGDYIIVNSRPTAHNGEVVVALVHGESATVKKFYRERDGRIRLQPANPSMSALYYRPDRVRIQGIETGVIRRYR
jgi:xanthosine utilization system XapX-like protein